ncbi:hypothetical protein BKA62DRAFT_793364 [Auriculariales sp. MPI-PUGE-AT-0066]|nr:hypothetical protein BKA62DRAFT_793364 [Auriculariales sp. MPI-PUGE-AT-0066]
MITDDHDHLPPMSRCNMPSDASAKASEHQSALNNSSIMLRESIGEDSECGPSPITGNKQSDASHPNQEVAVNMRGEYEEEGASGSGRKKRGGRDRNGGGRGSQRRVDDNQKRTDDKGGNTTNGRRQAGGDAAEIARLRQELANERRAAREREQDLSNALAQAEAQLATARAGANAMRDFVEAESVDGQANRSLAIIARFNDLVEAVNDLCFCVVSKLGDKDLSAGLRPQAINWLSHHSDFSQLVDLYLWLMQAANAAVSEVVLPVMQAIVFTSLTNLFAPFCPTASHAPDVNKTVLWLSNQVTQNETQERAGRWRVITYNAIRKDTDDDLAKKLVEQTHSRLTLILQTLLPWSWPAQEFIKTTLDELSSRSHKTFLEAIQLQHSIKTDYISCDYTIFFPTAFRQFVSSHEELVEGFEVTDSLAGAIKPSDKGKVLLPVTVGLRATKTDAGKQSQTILVKAKVIAVL